MNPALQQALHALQSGDAEAALAACRGLLAADPRDHGALQLFGIACRRLGRLDEAESAMRRSVELAPGDAGYRNNLGQLLALRGRVPEALEQLQRSLALAPDFRPARLALVRVANQSGQAELAEREARKLIAADARDAEAWSALGSALFARQRIAEALEALRRAVDLSPAYGAARQNLAAVLASDDRSDEALAEVAQCEKLGLGGRPLQLTRARALMQLDRYDDCEAVLLGIVADAPDEREAQFLLAQLRHIRGDADFARELRAAAGRPGAPLTTRAQYGDVLRRTGRFAEAEAVVRGLLAAEGPVPQLQSALATVLQETGRFPEAVAAARSAFQALPDDATVAENLVANLISAGDAAAARDIVERFHARQPTDQRWITYRTDIARQLGEPLFSEWCDLERLVRVYDIEPPPGYRAIADFHAALRPVLESRHRQAMHPLDQSLRAGTQTSRGLLADPDPLIRAYLAQLAQPLANYQAAIGQDAAHPMLARNRAPARPVSCWSVRLRRGGFHVNHIHPEGWISSAYYVSVPAEVADQEAQSGWIKFAEPRFPAPGAAPLRTVQPREGRLVLFPSYLWHGTNAIRGDEPRLTIAFDCRPAI